jgi:hypothetical protein
MASPASRAHISLHKPAAAFPESDEREKMDRDQAISRLRGCYVTLPTMFRDSDGLPIDLDAIRRHVRFLIDAGLRTGNGVLLATGAAGDFSMKGVKIQICSSGCGSVVLMQETAEVVTALDGTAGWWVQLCRFGWPERESTMRALGVVGR